MTATATDKYFIRVTTASPRKLAFPQCPPEPASSSCTHCCCAAWPCRLTRHPSPSCTEQWDTACPALPDNGWPPKQGWCYNAHSLPMFFVKAWEPEKGIMGMACWEAKSLNLPAHSRSFDRSLWTFSSVWDHVVWSRDASNLMGHKTVEMPQKTSMRNNLVSHWRNVSF